MTLKFLFLFLNMPKIWFKYVDNNFVVWNHGWNSLNDYMQLTIKLEKDDKFPFLDVLNLQWQQGFKCQNSERTEGFKFVYQFRTGSTQPREDNWAATWLRSSGSD